MWHRRIALALAILAAVLLVTSGLGVRAGLWPFRFGFGMFAGSLIAGLAAAGSAAVALAMPRLRAGALSMLVFALLLGLASAAVPLDYVRRVKTLPYINDITTDTQKPPEFRVATVSQYPSHFAELQRIGYPDLAPLELPLAPAQAFARARAAAQALGWEIVAEDERAGRIEAVATTRWFGFKDDIVVRVVAAGSGSRIDVRSRSRVGRSDLGANAKRIQDFLTRVKALQSLSSAGHEHGFQAHPARGLHSRRARARLRNPAGGYFSAHRRDRRCAHAPGAAARADRGHRRAPHDGDDGLLRSGIAHRQHADGRVGRLLLLRLRARPANPVLHGRVAEPRRAHRILLRARGGAALARRGRLGERGFEKTGILNLPFHETGVGT
jgi:uncharacterized protein (DUF1499 family)